MKEKTYYEAPEIEVVDFSLMDSIADSNGAGFYEEVYWGEL